ncbi:MAG: methionyl-tRNA formyltransferase [Comamonadaceae bacterium]|nr:MAG: methionyl-tRNA formyltransferase [Comamonadaceae bacterium]
MRVIFAGTPEFAAVALAAIHAAGHDIPLVLTQPDRPAGRGMKLQASAVKQWALAQDIPFAQPRSLRLDGKYADDAAAAREAIATARADIMVVAAYGLILPQWVLDAPPRGCLNIHGSLLPRWRGAAPIHRAIEAGDADTGITIMQMDAGLDTGDMLLAERMPIGPDDTTATLHDRLAERGGQLIVRALELAGKNALQRVPQPADGVTYASKIDKSESRIDWQQPADLIARRIRAFDPFPAASTQCGDDAIKLWRAQVEPGPASADGTAPAAGTVLSASAEGVCVACGQGVLRLTELQRAGGKRLAAGDFLRGFALQPGQVLG